MIHFWLRAGFFLLHVSCPIVLAAEPELVLLNVLYRHGDRTPDVIETYPNDPYINYTYYPIGRGGLTNGGKLRTYQLGKLLKSLYGDFLGSIYVPEVLVSHSTDFDRIKMSLQIVLSALYPPEPVQRWNDELHWQPIPAVYSPLYQDIILLPHLCSSTYAAEFNRIRNTAEVQAKIAQFDELMKRLGELTGQTINDTRVLDRIYHVFEGQSAANLALPEWVCEFHSGLLNAAIFERELMSYNDVLKRKFGGTLLRKITDDVASYANGTLEKGRKLFQYSAHEVNIASFQLALGVYQPHIPAYSSAMIVEIWQQNGDLFVKVLYYTGIPAQLYTQQIPGCEVLCPFDKFMKLLKSVIATDSDFVCD